MKVNVLGTEYEIVQANEQDYPYLEQADGFCDTSIKKIVVRDCKDKENDPSSLGNLEYYKKKVIRHELIHAFLYESGLSVNSDWATSEEMTDFFAIQFPKFQKVFEELKII
jgi:hypothetical protein